MLHVVDRTRRRGEVEDIVHGTAVVWVCDVQLQKFKPRFILQMSDVGPSAGDQIVHTNYAMAFAQKSVAEMGAQKSGAAGDQNAHLLRPRILQESSSGAELLLLLGFGCEFLKLRCRTAHADVHQSVSLHLFTAVEVSSIHYDWI